MSKSRISSVAVSPSASASASSHDPHSLPPNFKGLVQRYLAVSLPTVTFTPELIDALDKAEIVIPPRIKVTMRWWKEDASSSLSVYPNLNSSLPPAIEAHQRLLRQQQQQQGPAHLDQMHQNPVQTHSPNDKACQAQVKNQTETRSPTRSAATAAASFAPSFLKKPWAGARFLNAFRMGRGKDKKGKEKNKASLVSSVTEHAHVSQEQSPDATVGKPLPMLPPAAFPLTVAYPVRCSLDQLHRYFQELSLLTLEIHVTPDLVASTAVPNLIDLFHNINGTFSGIFPFSRILKNNAANLVYGTFFRPDVVLGMVVFQAWSQDTSEVSETSEESESASLASTSHQQSYHGPSQDPRLLNFHPRPHSQPAPLPRRLDLDAAHQCGSGPGMLQQSHWTTLAHGSVESAPLHQSSLCFENKHSAVPPAKRGRDFSRSHVSYVDSPAPLISPVDRFHVSDQPTKLQDRNNARNSFHKVTIPVPEVDPSEERHNPHKRYGIAQSSLSESMPYRDRRRSQDTTRTNVTSQGSRSRPRSGATAAAIGRLDAVLARGQDLLQGMKTSLALDPTEVRVRSAKSLRSSFLRDARGDDVFGPHHDMLPYWPSKSRFNLELSIPTAYLTSQGLLKGSVDSPQPAISHTGTRRSKVSVMPEQPFNLREARPTLTGSRSPHDSIPRLRRFRAPMQSGNHHPSAAPKWGEFELRDDRSPRDQYHSFRGSEASLRLHSQRSLNADRAEKLASSSWPQEQEPRPKTSPGHARKSKSYPPPPSSTRSHGPRSSSTQGHQQPTGDPNRKHKRRLSSHDRLQIRMNPRAGDLFNDLPDLFPVRNTSALLRPQYVSSSITSDGTTSNGGTMTSDDLSLTESSSHNSVKVTGRGRPSGRQSRLQKRPKEYSRHRHDGSLKPDKRRTMQSKASKRAAADPVHAQHFNFKSQSQLVLTPEVMAACVLENISVEVWKLNNKRQTMVELGTAKLPLHKILSRIMQRTTEVQSFCSYEHPDHKFETGKHHGGAQEGEFPGSKMERDRRRLGESYKEEGWRLEPCLYDIRSRHGTIIGQLDADIWIHPRTRSDSMVSAAA